MIQNRVIVFGSCLSMASSRHIWEAEMGHRRFFAARRQSSQPDDVPSQTNPATPPGRVRPLLKFIRSLVSSASMKRAHVDSFPPSVCAKLITYRLSGVIALVGCWPILATKADRGRRVRPSGTPLRAAKGVRPARRRCRSGSGNLRTDSATKAGIARHRDSLSAAVDSELAEDS
jgi:hypothetical protein